MHLTCGPGAMLPYTVRYSTHHISASKACGISCVTFASHMQLRSGRTLTAVCLQARARPHNVIQLRAQLAISNNDPA